MLARSASSRFPLFVIALHWAMALLLCATAVLGIYMVELSFSAQKLRFYAWHKWLGCTVFLLAAWRVAGRLLYVRQAAWLAGPRWQGIAASVAHAALYALMFSVPLSGWLMSSAKGVSTVVFGLLPLPNLLVRDRALGEALHSLHIYLVIAMGGLVVMHVLAAVKHHFIDQDDVLLQMLPACLRGRK